MIHLRHTVGNGGDCVVCALSMLLDKDYDDVSKAVKYKGWGVQRRITFEYIQRSGYSIKKTQRLGKGVRGVMFIFVFSHEYLSGQHMVAVDEQGMAHDSNAQNPVKWNNIQEVYPYHTVKILRRYEISKR